MAGEKTEKATPKRREEARKKGQVARSADLGGAVVLIAGLAALIITGPAMAERLGDAMRRTLVLTADPEVVVEGGLGALVLPAMRDVMLGVAPVALASVLAGVAVNVMQVGTRPMPGALKPQASRLNPVNGIKNLVGPNLVFETLKNLSKVGVVGAIVAAALLPKLPEFGSLMGLEPIEVGMRLSTDIRGLAIRAAAAYLLIGAIDFAWQRHRHEKQLKMDVQEVKEEAKQQAVPAEVRGAIRRRQAAAARARMMAAVPEADVVVTNPTHFSVALKYDGSRAAPQVIAKGQDLIALRIREVAREHGVPVVPEPPLARALHASVEVGQEIPEELYVAVAQILAWVFRQRPRRAA